MTLSLRARLLVGVVALVLAGLLVADTATYVTLQQSLVAHVDEQLGAARDRLVGPTPGPPHKPPPPDLPPQSYLGLAAPDGTWLPTSPASADRPDLPRPLPNAWPDSTQVTRAGAGAVSEYRVLLQPLDAAGSEFLVIAVPLTDVQSTLRALVVLEAIIGGAVLLGMVGLAWWIIRVGLRPLERIGHTAQAIAHGDLSRRVQPATPRTEIGRLGLALNGMLAQIESAFAERTRSEQRLRRFVADASHELRTPLTSIRGYAELLRRGADRSPQDSALARRRIEQEAVRMSALVDDLLLLARLDQGRPLERAPVDLQAIARDACADAGAVAPARAITLTAPRPLVVSGDEMRLRQVVANLLRNALVHTPPGTPVEVAVGLQDGQAVLGIADHGPGLPQEAAARVFEPFYRADPGRSRDRGGSGLGLSIVAAVVAAHGGHVETSSTPGGGATFRVFLPVNGAA